MRNEGKLDWDLLLKIDYGRLKTSMLAVGFEPTDFEFKVQITIRYRGGGEGGVTSYQFDHCPVIGL